MAASLRELCQAGKLEEARAALARGGKVNQTTAGGNTGLMCAAAQGHESVVELLLQQPGLDVNLTREGSRRTALHAASSYGRAGIVRMLLAHPSLTCQNAGDRDGRTPLMWAVGFNHVRIARPSLSERRGDFALGSTMWSV